MFALALTALTSEGEVGSPYAVGWILIALAWSIIGALWLVGGFLTQRSSRLTGLASARKAP